MKVLLLAIVETQVLVLLKVAIETLGGCLT
jgi:hypothetical protein